ncbi:MAG: biliverdin-producing heme oxygenase [Pseudorhodoplanes sp.]
MGLENPSPAVVAAKPLSLSEALRERTVSVHLAAERSGIISDILKRKADRNSYALLLRNILPAYEALETALARRSADAVLSVFALPALFRSQALRNDLAAIAGADWERSLPLLDAGARYAARVSLGAQGNGMRLVPHAYVRYFGDLSGGQVLKKLLGQSMDLPQDALTLYDFPGIVDHRAFKQELREAIDRAADSVADPEDLIAEALIAFEHNIEVSHAVQSQLADTATITKAAAGKD